MEKVDFLDLIRSLRFIAKARTDEDIAEHSIFNIRIGKKMLRSGFS